MMRGLNCVSMSGARARTVCETALLGVLLAAWLALAFFGLAGSAGADEVEASEVAEVAVASSAHMQTYGDIEGDGGLAGLPGEDKRLEALAVSVEAPEGVDLGVSYAVYCEGYGWLEGADGELAGTSEESLSVSRVVVELTGEDADAYTVWYRAWVDGYGWTGWAYEGQECGTHSAGATVEAVEVVVLAAGEAAPGDVTPRVVTSAATCGEQAEQADGSSSDDSSKAAEQEQEQEETIEQEASADADDADAVDGSAAADSSSTSASESTSSDSTSDSSSDSTASDAASTVVDETYDAEGDVGCVTSIEIAADDHNHVYVETHVEATCVSVAYDIYTCTVCGYFYYSQTYGDLADHDYAISATDVEYDEQGATIVTTTYTCTVCGDSYSETDTTDAEEDAEETSASTVVDGEYDSEGDIGCVTSIEIAADDHDHVYVETYVDATCVQLGYTIYTCTICDYFYYGEIEYGDLADHDYVEVVDEETGEVSLVCSVCGDVSE